MRASLIVALVLLVPAGARASRDCLAPLEANAGWSCRAELSTGGSVDFCLELTNVFGDDPASRYFKRTTTGPYWDACSCQARGKFGFGEDAAYLCINRDAGTVESGRISKKRISAQTFSASANVRASYTCEPNPSCDVQPVVDPDLPPEGGSAALSATQYVERSVSAGGEIDIGYLPGCVGYASEAPTFVFDVEAEAAGFLVFAFVPVGADFAIGTLVVFPSGEARCAAEDEELPVEHGSYRVWVPADTPATLLQGKIAGKYDADD